MTENMAPRELAVSYNTAVVQDSLVRMTVRALSFLTNGNRFRHKKSVLEAVHENAFGKKIPAYKSFEGQLVNANHTMRDQGKATNVPIGYVEQSHLRKDGVYLDLVLWKRCLDDDQLTQVREKSVTVSMELDYTDPLWILPDGAAVPAPKRKKGEKLKVPPGVVRTMAENSIASFVGIAVLFDGLKPGDSKAITLASENASLDDQDGQGEVFLEPQSDTETLMSDLTEKTTPPEGLAEGAETVPEVIPEVIPEVTPVTPAPEATPEPALEETPAEHPTPESEIAALRTQLAEQVSAREKAEADLNALHSDKQALEEKLIENDAKFSEVMTEFNSLRTQMDAVREEAFTANMAANFNLETLTPEDKQWLTAHMRYNHFGVTDPKDFADAALRLKAVGESVTTVAPSTDEGESASETAERKPQPPAADFSIAGGAPQKKQWGKEHL